jgi:hypothetical protein
MLLIAFRVPSHLPCSRRSQACCPFSCGNRVCSGLRQQQNFYFRVAIGGRGILEFMLGCYNSLRLAPKSSMVTFQLAMGLDWLWGQLTNGDFG